MSRNRIIYNVQALYAGPAPDNNLHFIDHSGVFSNDCVDRPSLINLVKHIPRVQDVSYSVNVPKTNVLQLGKQGTLRQQITEPPQIGLSFSYLQTSVLNEARLGFLVNYERDYEPYMGSPFYADTYSVFTLWGFLERERDREENDLRWPYKYRDKRNFYVAVNADQSDLKTQNTEYHEIDPNAKNWSVYAFGGCQLNAYKANASVGALPFVSVDYSCDNIVFHSSGSGAYIPSVNTKTFAGYKDIKFALPSPTDGLNMPSALLPGDITLDITSKPQLTGVPAIVGGAYLGNVGANYSKIDNIGIDFSDMRVQSYELNINLDRRENKSIGYRLPVDREIQFPTFVTTTISLLVGDLGTGGIEQLYRRNDDYDLDIKLRNPIKSGVQEGIAVQYLLRRAKLDNYSYSAAIGNNNLINLTFTTELDPQDLSKGLFISGLMNTDDVGSSQMVSSYWIDDDGTYVITEDNDRIYSSLFYCIL